MKIESAKTAAAELAVCTFINVTAREASAEMTIIMGTSALQSLSPLSVEKVYFEKSLIKLVLFIVTKTGKSPIVPLVKLSALASSSTHTIACLFLSFVTKSKLSSALWRISLFPIALKNISITAIGVYM